MPIIVMLLAECLQTLGKGIGERSQRKGALVVGACVVLNMA